MDNSTEGVTLLNVFILDVIREVEQLEEVDLTDFRKLYSEVSLENPYDVNSIEVYNAICDWAEKNTSEEVFMQISKSIGNSVYQGLIENNIIDESTPPEDVLEGLVLAAASLVQDEKERGWVILDSSSDHMLMRRTQTFNSKLQIGMIIGLVEKCEGISTAKVIYEKEVAKGDEYDDYLVTWERA
jgi:hypothetical protein